MYSFEECGQTPGTGWDAPSSVRMRALSLKMFNSLTMYILGFVRIICIALSLALVSYMQSKMYKVKNSLHGGLVNGPVPLIDTTRVYVWCANKGVYLVGSSKEVPTNLKLNMEKGNSIFSHQYQQYSVAKKNKKQTRIGSL